MRVVIRSRDNAHSITTKRPISVASVRGTRPLRQRQRRSSNDPLVVLQHAADRRLYMYTTNNTDAVNDISRGRPLVVLGTPKVCVCVCVERVLLLVFAL